MQKNNIEEKLDDLIQNIVKRPIMYYSTFASIREGFCNLLYIRYDDAVLVDQIFYKYFEDFVIERFSNFKYKNYNIPASNISKLQERLNNIVRELDNQIFK